MLWLKAARKKVVEWVDTGRQEIKQAAKQRGSCVMFLSSAVWQKKKKEKRKKKK